MSKITSINVTACDNEIIIIASQELGSSEICHLKSGHDAPVSYVVNPFHMLAPGDYDLTVICVNWGGASNFEVEISGDSPTTILGGGPEVGVAYHKTIPMTVG